MVWRSIPHWSGSKEYRREYMRQWRAENAKRSQQYQHDYFQNWYWGDQRNREHHRKRNREHMAEMRAKGDAARRTLRSLMRLGPRTTRLIRGHIDIESASDAQVVAFLRQLQWRLSHEVHGKRR